MPTDELRHLADALRHLDAAAAAADWDDDAALARAESRAHAELAAVDRGADIAAAAANPWWRTRAQSRAGDAPRAATPQEARANAVVAVGLARIALAEAVIAVAAARRATTEAAGAPVRSAAARNLLTQLGSLRGPVVSEVRHLLADRPRAILARIVVTLAIALSMVTFYHLTGLTRYDDAGRLTLYLFSAVVGSLHQRAVFRGGPGPRDAGARRAAVADPGGEEPGDGGDDHLGGAARDRAARSGR
ncbi:hypothetical protein [Mycolicibacterium parafortuitum]|uniref:hypothetical protein n=1 Tax=Mycolicibacterium parafortuitum TaxID=39692 RepID=UPI0032C3ED41